MKLSYTTKTLRKLASAVNYPLNSRHPDNLLSYNKWRANNANIGALGALPYMPHGSVKWDGGAIPFYALWSSPAWYTQRWRGRIGRSDLNKDDDDKRKMLLDFGGFAPDTEDRRVAHSGLIALRNYNRRIFEKDGRNASQDAPIEDRIPRYIYQKASPQILQFWNATKEVAQQQPMHTGYETGLDTAVG